MYIKKVARSLLSFAVMAALLFLPTVVQAYDPVISIRVPYEAKVTQELHGISGTAYDFSQMPGEQSIFRVLTTGSFQIRGVVDDVRVIDAYDSNRDFSHREKNVYVQIQAAYPGSEIWVNVARLLYAHLDENTSLKEGDIVQPGGVIGSNSTGHRGPKNWYSDPNQQDLLTTGPHLHFECRNRSVGWDFTVFPLFKEEPPYPISTNVYQLVCEFTAWPLRNEEMTP